MKLSTSYVNYTIAQYIIEPIKDLDEWLKDHKYKLILENMVDIEYVYCRDKYAHILSSTNTIMAKIILKNNIDKIKWHSLCYNTSNWAGDILKNNLDKIDWRKLCCNKSYWAGKILKNNLDKIDWFSFSSNPNIFVPNIQKTNKYYKLFDSLLYKKLI